MYTSGHRDRDRDGDKNRKGRTDNHKRGIHEEHTKDYTVDTEKQADGQRDGHTERNAQNDT